MLKPRVSNLILFLSGVIFSALASSLLEQVLDLSLALLIVTIVLLTLSALYFFAQSTERIQNLSDGMETSVRYVEELYREQEGIPYKGIVFDELTNLISEAEKEILIFAATFGNAYRVSQHPARVKYFQAIEKNLT